MTATAAVAETFDPVRRSAGILGSGRGTVRQHEGEFFRAEITGAVFS